MSVKFEVNFESLFERLVDYTVKLEANFESLFERLVDYIVIDDIRAITSIF